MYLQVWLLKWDGQAVQIAAYGAGPRAALLGALPDRLILVRSAPGGRAQMATRAVSLLPPLLQAWASLPASGLLPGTPPPNLVMAGMNNLARSCCKIVACCRLKVVCCPR